jgi:hypothetical protein
MSSEPLDSSSDPYEWLRSQLETCNHTELYQLCRGKGLQVSPRMMRPTLIQAFLDGVLVQPEQNVFDSWRHGLTGFVFDHWNKLEPQLTCPIRSKDPRSCWGCLDAQVIACVEDNPKYEPLIRLHRKDEP